MHMPPAAEALHFDNAPVAHIVAHQERQRIERIHRDSRKVLRPRYGARA